MSNYNWPFGYRDDWRFNTRGDMYKKTVHAEPNDSESKRGIVQDCLVAESAEREADRKARKYSSKELVAMLPECEPTTKSIDEIVHETLSIINLIDGSDWS